MALPLWPLEVWTPQEPWRGAVGPQLLLGSVKLRSGHLDASNTSNTLCVPQSIPEPLLLCGSEHYPAERGPSQQGISFPWKFHVFWTSINWISEPWWPMTPSPVHHCSLLPNIPHPPDRCHVESLLFISPAGGYDVMLDGRILDDIITGVLPNVSQELRHGQCVNVICWAERKSYADKVPECCGPLGLIPVMYQAVVVRHDQMTINNFNRNASKSQVPSCNEVSSATKSHHCEGTINSEDTEISQKPPPPDFSTQSRSCGTVAHLRAGFCFKGGNWLNALLK